MGDKFYTQMNTLILNGEAGTQVRLNFENKEATYVELDEEGKVSYESVMSLSEVKNVFESLDMFFEE